MFTKKTVLIFLSYFTYFSDGGAKNVLFVITDDLRLYIDDNFKIFTPNIDGFCKNSVVFTNAFAQVGFGFVLFILVNFLWVLDGFMRAESEFVINKSEAGFFAVV